MRHVLQAIILAVIACLSLGASFTQAEAAKLHFGEDEKLHVITGTKLVADGKPLSLCYKTYTYYMIAGIYTTDQYVLCEGGASTKYWPMPAGERLASMQQQGLLPSPLPTYSRDAIEYVLGYSLWLVIAFVALWMVFDGIRSKSEAPRNLDLLKSTARRIMARMISNASGGTDHGVAMARQIYQGLFNEPLLDSDFAEDMAWVRQQPAAYDGFIGAMGRKFDANARQILLKAAAHVALADGIMDPAEEEALHHLALKLGMKRKDADAFLATLRRQSAGASQPSA